MNYKQLLDLAIKTGRLECDGDYVVSGFSPSTYECDEQELYQYILMGKQPTDENENWEAVKLLIEHFNIHVGDLSDPASWVYGHRDQCATNDPKIVALVRRATGEAK